MLQQQRPSRTFFGIKFMSCIYESSTCFVTLSDYGVINHSCYDQSLLLVYGTEVGMKESCDDVRTLVLSPWPSCGTTNPVALSAGRQTSLQPDSHRRQTATRRLKGSSLGGAPRRSSSLLIALHRSHLSSGFEPHRLLLGCVSTTKRWPSALQTGHITVFSGLIVC